MSKNTVLFDTINSEASNFNEYDIEKIDWAYYKDSNNSSYQSNYVKFDLDALANASYFTDFSAGYFFLCQDIRVEGMAGTTAGALGIGSSAVASDDFSVSLKASIMDTLNSVTIKFNDNIQVNNNSQYLNRFANWQLLQMSASDLVNIKDLINFNPDTPAIGKSVANSVNAPAGMEYNNVVADAAYNISNGYIPEQFNKGRLNRMKTTSFNYTRIQTFYANALNNPIQLNEMQKSNTNGNISGVQTYTIFSIIPLALIHPIFQSMPVCRGVKLNMQIQLNMNHTSIITCTQTGSNIGPHTYSAYSGTSGSGSNTCPYMISPLNVLGAGGAVVTTNGTSCNAIFGVQPNYNITIKNSVNTSYPCQLYLPQIHFTPAFEKAYCANPVKTIQYLDYNVYLPNGLNPCLKNANANQVLLTNSVIRPRDLIIIPEVSSLSNGGSDPQSTPFSSAPFTSAPYARINNFNILINNVPIWPQAKNYTYEMYIETMSKLALDGRQFRHMGVSSGLVSKAQWEAGYAYYYNDIDRSKFEQDDNLGKAVSITLTNGSLALDMKFYCILTYQRELDIDVSIGTIVQKL